MEDATVGGLYLIGAMLTVPVLLAWFALAVTAIYECITDK